MPYVTGFGTWGNAAKIAGAGPVTAVFAAFVLVFAAVFPVTRTRSPVFGADFMDDEPKAPVLETVGGGNAAIGAVGEAWIAAKET